MTRHATFMLVVVTLLWGLSFPMTKAWQNAAVHCPGGPLLSACTLIALRMTLGFLVLLLLRPDLRSGAGRREHAGGALLGVVFFLGFVLQMWGLAYTSPSISAFITSLGSAWVPLLAWLFLGLRVARLTLAGLAVGVLGTGILSLSGDGGWQFGRGELLTLAASVLFAVQILVLDRLGKRVQPRCLTLGFFAASAVLAAVLGLILAVLGPGSSAWAGWTLDMLGNWRLALILAGLVIFPTILAFHWMNAYQPSVPPGRAALVYLLEPIFAALISVPLGLDQLTLELLLGGGLILAGNLIVEWRGHPPHAGEPVLDASGVQLADE